MGKFMRKCKEMGEVAVVEVPPVGGARTRARALAELRKRSSVGSEELQVSYLELRSRRLAKNGPPKEKKREFGSRVVAQESPAVNSGAGDEDARVSMCSGTGSSEEDKVAAVRSGSVSDPEVRIPIRFLFFISETVFDVGKLFEGGFPVVNGERFSCVLSLNSCSSSSCLFSVRETTPPSDLRAESEALESTTISAFNDSANYRRKPSRVAARTTPPASEIEEFFAAFEKEEERRFAEKYNYDVVKDIPLAGRYEWVKVTP
ncbi:Cyclin-dependent kinase inhibitor 3 [Nymphaea thermarum]|nr:Cyclin-dependent kinase inhibitor 3 [Nymphaea thermarum]